MNINYTIGNNIKDILKKHEVTIKEFSKIIGVSRQTAASYINGTSIIPSDKLFIVAGYFDKEIDWFLEEEHHNKFKFYFN